MLFNFLLMFVAAAAIARAQYVSTITPDSVPLGTRQTWCQSQKSQCPLICLQSPGASGTPKENSCSPDTLVYQCVCNNGLSPNASEYSLTMPYYICTEAATQCVNKCQDSACQSACRDDHPCGAQKPERVNISSTSTQAATTTSMANIQATNVPSGAASRSIPVDGGNLYGPCVQIGVFIAGVAILL